MSLIFFPPCFFLPSISTCQSCKLCWLVLCCLCLFVCDVTRCLSSSLIKREKERPRLTTTIEGSIHAHLNLLTYAPSLVCLIRQAYTQCRQMNCHAPIILLKNFVSCTWQTEILRERHSDPILILITSSCVSCVYEVLSLMAYFEILISFYGQPIGRNYYFFSLAKKYQEP